jgi:hypothetical protein
MIMKQIFWLAIMCIGTAQTSAQVTLIEHEWNATMKVVDETGQPIEGAKASIGYFSKSQPKSIDGLTDTNGIFRASHRAYSGILGFTAEKAGFYMTREPSYELGFTYDYSIWNPTQTIVVRRINNPIPMCAKSLNTHLPILDKPVGYDLLVGDWVGLYGNGVNADILFKGHFDKRDDGESDFTLTVDFPQNGDGIQEFKVPDIEKGSALHSLYNAPVDGYQSQWVQTDNRKPRRPIDTNRDPSRNYYFRVRTVIDDRGNIVSAHYGKIYGDFMRFKYYFNPTPNDRNVEFDPKRNLMKNLGPLEGVSEP